MADGGSPGGWRAIRRGATEIPVVAAAALLGLVLTSVTADPRWLIVAAVIAAAAVLTLRFAGPRGAGAALCFLLVSPGVIGESSLILTVLALVGLLVLALTYSPDSTTESSTFWIFGLAFLALAVAVVLDGGGPVAAAYPLAGVVALSAMSRASFVRDASVGLACVFGALTFCYVLSLLIGFSENGISTFALGGRSLDLSLPLTLTTGGPPFIPGSRRFSPLVGEPGLAIYYFVPIFCQILASAARASAKALGVGAVVVAIVFTQSLGSIVAVVGALALYGLAHLAVNLKRPAVAAVLAVTGVGVAAPVLLFLLEYKGNVAAQSITDRGIFDAGDRSSAALGSINLLTAFSNNPPLAVALCVGLGAMGAAAVRHLAGVLAFTMFAITSAFSQPSQWQIGAWLLLAMSLTLVAQTMALAGRAQTMALAGRAQTSREPIAVSNVGSRAEERLRTLARRLAGRARLALPSWTHREPTSPHSGSPRLVAVMAIGLTVLAVGTDLVTKAMSVPVPAVVRLPGAEPVAVFLGDSYTAGAGANRGDRFTTRIAKARGWHEVNLGYGGTGYVGATGGELAPVACARHYCPSYTDLIGVVAASHPDIVVVTGGRHDVSFASTVYWANGVTAFFVALHNAAPEARIIATSPIWDDDLPPDGLDVMRAVVQDAVTAVGGSYVDLGDPLLGRPDLVAGDGVQLNDAGHEAIAAAFLAA